MAENIINFLLKIIPTLNKIICKKHKKLLDCVEDASVYLEEYTRGMIGQEEQHSLELKKMLKDFS